MCPSDLEVLCNGVIRQTLVAGLRGKRAGIDVTRILVTFLVSGLSRHTPGALGEYLTQNLEVKIIGQGKIVTAVLEIETSLHLITVCGNDYARCIVTLQEREESERDEQRQRHTHNLQICGAEYDIASGTHLGTGYAYVEVGVIMLVTGGIDAIGYIILAVGALLGLLACHIALTLLGYDLVDVTLLGLEVIADMV